MRAASTLTQNILSSGTYDIVGLYDITLATGQTYHFTDSDVPFPGISVTTKGGTQGPFDYATGFTIVRGKIGTKSGADAGTMDVTFAPQPDNPGGAPTIAGYQIGLAAKYGFLRGASVQYNKLFLNSAIGANTSAVGWFRGSVQEIQADSLSVQLTVDDFLAYLGNQQMPRLLWQTGCFHEVYDAGCTLLKSAFTVSGTLTSVGDSAHFVASALTQPTGYFNLGVLTFTSGANSGVQGPVNSFTSGGAFAMRFPFPVTPSVGDTFTAYPGCDKQQATCSNTDAAAGPAFNNLAHFSGTPYVPVPETTLDGGTDNPPAQTQGATAGTIIGSQPSGKQIYGPYQT